MSNSQQRKRLTVQEQLQQSSFLKVSFYTSQVFILASWLNLIFAPEWSGTKRCQSVGIMAAALVNMYGLWGMKFLGQERGRFSSNDGLTPKDMGFFSLKGLVAIFRTAHIHLLTGMWFHFLTLDLITANVLVRDALTYGFHWAFVSVCLVTLCAFGPTGVVVYLIPRVWYIGSIDMF